MQVGRFSRFQHLAGHIVADDGGNFARDCDQFVEIDPRVVTHFLEHVNEIFRADISRRAGRERATAQARHRRIVTHDAHLQSGEHVGQSHAARIVKVQRDVRAGKALHHRAA